MLLALAIMAALLAAVAMAMQASMQSYNENDDSAMVTQAARTTVERIIRRVRSAYEADSSGTSLTVYLDSGLSCYVTYEFVDGCLYRHEVSGAGQETHILLGDKNITVDSFDVLREENLEGDTLGVKIRLAVSSDNSSMSVTASASLRRAQSY